MASALRKLTEAEYLASEETSPVKREYVDGFVYPLHAQAGATGKPNKIAASLFAQRCRHRKEPPPARGPEPESRRT